MNLNAGINPDTMERGGDKVERRIIAIQMLPKAYNEIQRLKGEETWTRFIIQCVLAKVGDNSILQDELASLTKEPKAEKPKKVKATRKSKAKVQEPAAEVTGERQPTENELKAEVPTGEREESMGIGTPVNKGEG